MKNKCQGRRSERSAAGSVMRGILVLKATLWPPYIIIINLCKLNLYVIFCHREGQFAFTLNINMLRRVRFLVQNKRMSLYYVSYDDII